jgi:hypothetical protein
MNEICEFELWSLPWHALQRSLAAGLETAVNLQNVAASANSWLSRAGRRPSAPRVAPAVSPANLRRRTPA